ncbi:MAG: MMPL family transporter [Deltaproteobacteria bacterium]|nr:MMPL family transporter [Deltaproteobacteria bacterium]
MLEKLIRRLIPHAWLLVLLMVAISAAVAPRALKLLTNISTELSKLLPDDYPTVQLSKEVKTKFKKKGGGDVILILESPDPVANRKAVEEMVLHLKKLPDVGEVKFLKAGQGIFFKSKLLYMELEDLESIRDRVRKRIQREKLGGLYVDFEGGEGSESLLSGDLSKKYHADYVRGKNPYHANETQTAFAVWVYPESKNTSLKFYGKFFKKLKAHVDLFEGKPPGMKISYAGSIRTRLDEYQTLIGDLTLAGIISMGGIFLLLWVYFRRIAAVILIFIPLVTGILIGFAISSFYFTHMNVVTSFLFSILFGLGVDIGIHMFSRYLEDRQGGLSREDAIVNILLRTGRSSSVAVMTTCATFFILVINDFRGFSEFGWIAGIGLTVTLLVYLIFFPALLLLAEQFKILRIKKEPQKKGFLGRFTLFPAAKKVMITGAVCLVLGLFTVPFIDFEWNYSILRTHLPETSAAKEKLKEITGRVNSPAAILFSGEEEARAVKEALKKKKTLDTLSPTIDYFRSAYDLVPDRQKEKRAVLSEIDRLLADDALNSLKGDEKTAVAEFRESIATTTQVIPEDITDDLRETYFGVGHYQKEEVAYVAPLPHLQLDDGRNAIAFHEDVGRIEAAGKTFIAASDSLIFAEVLTTLFSDSRKTILLSLLVLAIMLYIDFWSWRKTWLVLGVLSAGIFWMCGTMLLFGLKFNFYNMIVLPMMIGMGEDNSVHLLHRFEEEKRSSVMKALGTSGKAALIASLTTMLGYAGLVFAHHPGLRSIGILAIIGMTTCMLASLIFLPALLQYFLRRL